MSASHLKTILATRSPRPDAKKSPAVPPPVPPPPVTPVLRTACAASSPSSVADGAIPPRPPARSLHNMSPTAAARYLAHLTAEAKRVGPPPVSSPSPPADMARYVDGLKAARHALFGALCPKPQVRSVPARAVIAAALARSAAGAAAPAHTHDPALPAPAARPKTGSKYGKGRPAPAPPAPAALTSAPVPAAPAAAGAPVLPRRPLSAYNLFFKEQRAALVSPYVSAGADVRGRGSGRSRYRRDGREGRRPNFGDMAKFIARKWNTMGEEEREVYFCRFRKNRDAYDACVLAAAKEATRLTRERKRAAVVAAAKGRGRAGGAPQQSAGDPVPAKRKKVQLAPPAVVGPAAEGEEVVYRAQPAAPSTLRAPAVGAGPGLAVRGVSHKRVHAAVHTHN